MDITVLTPTFNRAKKIVELYESLKRQTIKDFIWMVVDDGSTDGTKSIIESFIQQSDFPIHYLSKSNGGKHTALNLGVGQIKTDLTFIVDSDDRLTPNAIETILQYHEKYKMNDGISGYVFLRQYPNGQVNGKRFEPDEIIASYIEMRINSDDTQSDKAEVFRTDCLKEFPFPVFEGEKFLGEDIVWARMGRKYSMVHINKAIYIGAYLADGLTKNRRKNNIMSPIGCMYRAKEFTKPDIKLIYRVKAALQIVIYGSFAGKKHKEIMNFLEYKWLMILCYLPGKILYKKWEKEMN